MWSCENSISKSKELSKKLGSLFSHFVLFHTPYEKHNSSLSFFCISPSQETPDDVTGQSNKVLQWSPGIRFQWLALGNESLLHTTKLLWKNTQETSRRDIRKSFPATHCSCQILHNQQKQMIFRWLLSISPQVLIHFRNREGMAHQDRERLCFSHRLSSFASLPRAWHCRREDVLVDRSRKEELRGLWTHNSAIFHADFNFRYPGLKAITHMLLTCSISSICKMAVIVVTLLLNWDKGKNAQDELWILLRLQLHEIYGT